MVDFFSSFCYLIIIPCEEVALSPLQDRRFFAKDIGSSSLTISNAIAVLQDIGVLSVDETLTALGEKIGCLPVHPLTSKMFLFSMLMNCLDPAFTLACASDYMYRSIYPSYASNEKNRATAAKFELASLYGGHSNQLAVIAVSECWKNAKNRGQDAWFCSPFFISPSTMDMLQAMRKQLQG